MSEAVVDYYALGLDGSKSFEELKRQIRKFLEKFNNQTKNAAPGSDAAAAAMKMKDLWGKALELFKTEEGRKAYDRELQAWKSSAQAKRMAEAAARNDADFGGAVETVLELVRRAWAALNDGRVSAASRLAEQAIDEDPRNWEAFLISGIAAYRQNDYDEARVALRRAARLNDKNALIYGCLGELFERQESWKDSYENYAQAIALEPDNIDYRVAIGLVCVKAEAPDAGIRYLRKALEMDPGNEGAKWALGVALAESARLGWTEVGEGQRVEAGWWTMSREQALQAVRKLHEANNLGVTDPDLARELADLKRDVDRQVKRKFTGSWVMLGIIALLGILTLSHGTGIVVLLFAAGYYTVNLMPQYAINARVLAGDSRLKQGFMNWYEGLENQYVKAGVSLIMLMALPLFMAYWGIRNWTGDNAPLGKELEGIRGSMAKTPTAPLPATADATDGSSVGGGLQPADEPAVTGARFDDGEVPTATSPRTGATASTAATDGSSVGGGLQPADEPAVTGARFDDGEVPTVTSPGTGATASTAATSASAAAPVSAASAAAPAVPVHAGSPVLGARNDAPLIALLRRKGVFYGLIGLLCVAIGAVALKVFLSGGNHTAPPSASVVSIETPIRQSGGQRKTSQTEPAQPPLTPLSMSAASTSPAPRVDPISDSPLRHAQTCWDSGNYACVDTEIRQILAVSPSEPNALEMQARLKRYQEARSQQVLAETEACLVAEDISCVEQQLPEIASLDKSGKLTTIIKKRLAVLKSELSTTK